MGAAKKILIFIGIFILVWLAINLIPIATVTLVGLNDSRKVYCTLNYVGSCFNTQFPVRDWGYYPKFLATESAPYIVSIIAPLILTTLIYIFINKKMNIR